MPKLLIDIDKIEDFDYFKQTNICRANLCRAIKNGIVLDNLTNGEAIQKMFPKAKVTIDGTTVCLKFEYYHEIWFDLDFWNAKWGE